MMTDYGPDELFVAMSSFGWGIKDALKNGLVQSICMTPVQSVRRQESSVGPSWVKFVSVVNPTDLMIGLTDTMRLLSERNVTFRAIWDSLTPFFIYNPPMLVAKILREYNLKMKKAGSVGTLVTHVQGSIDPQSESIIKASVDNVLHLRDDGKLVVEGMLATPKTTASYDITRAGITVSS